MYIWQDVRRIWKELPQEIKGQTAQVLSGQQTHCTRRSTSEHIEMSVRHEEIHTVSHQETQMKAVVESMSSPTEWLKVVWKYQTQQGSGERKWVVGI
jgi:ketopantoate reductase